MGICSRCDEVWYFGHCDIKADARDRKTGKNMNTINPDLKEKRCWLIGSDFIGHRILAIGVAQALQIPFEEKLVDPPWLYEKLSPFAGVAPSERIGEPGSALFPPPFPDLVIGVGRQSVPYLRAFKKKSAGKTFTVMLQDPRRGTSVADLIWVPEHDRLRGENVITTLISPHRYTPDMIRDLRKKPLDEIARLPGPHIGLIIGGDSKAYTYSEENIRKLVQAISSLKPFAGSFLVTCSRRTPPALESALRALMQDVPCFFWKGKGHNPYGDFLANSDYFVVTADSVNMVGEAAVSGRPVYVFFPEGGGRRIDYFHKRMQEEGITKPLPAHFSQLESWTYEPQYAADYIAEEIRKRWL